MGDYRAKMAEEKKKMKKRETGRKFFHRNVTLDYGKAVFFKPMGKLCHFRLFTSYPF